MWWGTSVPVCMPLEICVKCCHIFFFFFFCSGIEDDSASLMQQKLEKQVGKVCFLASFVDFPLKICLCFFVIALLKSRAHMSSVIVFFWLACFFRNACVISPTDYSGAFVSFWLFPSESSGFQTLTWSTDVKLRARGPNPAHNIIFCGFHEISRGVWLFWKSKYFTKHCNI